MTKQETKDMIMSLVDLSADLFIEVFEEDLVSVSSIQTGQVIDFNFEGVK